MTSNHDMWHLTMACDLWPWHVTCDQDMWVQALTCDSWYLISDSGLLFLILACDFWHWDMSSDVTSDNYDISFVRDHVNEIYITCQVSNLWKIPLHLVICYTSTISAYMSWLYMLLYIFCYWIKLVSPMHCLCSEYVTCGNNLGASHKICKNI